MVTETLARCPNGVSRTAVHPSRTIRSEGAAGSAFCVVQVADAARQSVLVLYATANPSGDFGVYNGLNIGGGKRFEPKLGPNSLVLEVVPGGCTGKEKLKKPKCRERSGVNRMTVKLVNGLEGDTFRVELSSGKTKQGTINEKGAGKAKFKKIPSGPGTATATFGCGAVKQKSYACP